MTKKRRLSITKLKKNVDGLYPALFILYMLANVFFLEVKYDSKL